MNADIFFPQFLPSFQLQTFGAEIKCPANSAKDVAFNPLNAELNPICHLLALLGVHHFLHVSGIRVK
jgi:hypothetical protein